MSSPTASHDANTSTPKDQTMRKKQKRRSFSTLFMLAYIIILSLTIDTAASAKKGAAKAERSPSNTNIATENAPPSAPAEEPAAAPQGQGNKSGASAANPSPQRRSGVAAAGGGGGAGTANPAVLVVVLGVLALAPFALIMLTSFVKISVVLSILRNALGTQQVPPNQVITGISLILTIFIMAPVAEKMYEQAGDMGNTDAIFSESSVQTLFDATKRGREPLRQFLERYAAERDRKMFYDLARRMAQKNGNDPQSIGQNDFRIVVPAFVTSQLTDAFKIGFLLFIPFLVIDMVVSNILQAMGMFMLSPAMISLPFKLLLFVLVDGWVVLIQTLVLSYT